MYNHNNLKGNLIIKGSRRTTHKDLRNKLSCKPSVLTLKVALHDCITNHQVLKKQTNNYSLNINTKCNHSYVALLVNNKH